jgi:hypothetical protein
LAAGDDESSALGLLTEPKLIPAALVRLVMFKGFALLEASFADEAFCDPLDELPPTASRLDFREC